MLSGGGGGGSEYRIADSTTKNKQRKLCCNFMILSTVANIAYLKVSVEIYLVGLTVEPLQEEEEVAVVEVEVLMLMILQYRASPLRWLH